MKLRVRFCDESRPRTEDREAWEMAKACSDSCALEGLLARFCISRTERDRCGLHEATKSPGLDFSLQEKATSIAQILLAWLLSAEHQPAGIPERGPGGRA